MNSVRERLREHIPQDSVDKLRELLQALRRAEDIHEPLPADALDVIREVAKRHIDHIEYHAGRLTELSALLAGTLQDSRRAFHAGQLNVAMMVVGRLTHTTARVCIEAVLDEEETSPGVIN